MLGGGGRKGCRGTMKRMDGRRQLLGVLEGMGADSAGCLSEFLKFKLVGEFRETKVFS